ncbi:PTS N-acetylgalactosamine transporter subunit IIC [Providencia stuartii]|uniref:PTS system, N-acetylgalactosamine-specific IIC component n=1 Tax=Providencia stuartii (strain MRSN 2154) TaxID=1157951 RepID=A0A140NIN4_PROSM|nr:MULTISPECIES: PTS N-acetylgalactosamine transporter subunit IIC [Providencia]AFH93624.1 PTS system, N-acetylgalactosamine-specific IIC component [Providencia stuartii MRSN 2154]MDE8747633.1 PTS N-acetylgalactosamine transporter subunit IIC [Providencia thailandensis]MDE8766639.1 PTS N-acetylgalactosamine transporter subunit IIC [Providencia thailandensis]MDE8779304.1 PTS N-acetylgalactosamine transporter subunit IIC [Providencia thailandensis]MDE8783394.1 PTS N-acetylgalactosamine transport
MMTDALLIALIAGIAGVDLFNGLTHFHRPVVIGPIVGLILGDVQTGLLVGGTLELVWMGMVPLAGAQPPNVVIGGIIGTTFAIMTHADPKVAIGIAVPFSIAVQGCITLLFTLYSPMMHKCDEMVKKLNWRGIEMVNYFGILILFSFYFIVAFLPIYFGADAASAMVQKAPQWLLDSLAVAGGMMPAIGFSLLMKIMMKKTYVAYFILGFISVTFLNMPIIAVALGAFAIALIDFFNRTRNDNNDNGSSPKVAQEMNDGI